MSVLDNELISLEAVGGNVEPTNDLIAAQKANIAKLEAQRVELAQQDLTNDPRIVEIDRKLGPEAQKLKSLRIFNFTYTMLII